MQVSLWRVRLWSSEPVFPVGKVGLEGKNFSWFKKCSSLAVTVLREISQAWHANADAWGAWLCATRFALPRSAKLALLSERISDDLRFAFQVDGQMHVLMSWLIWSQKSKEPPSWTKEEYEGGQIGLQDSVLCILPDQSCLANCRKQQRLSQSGFMTWTGWTCATLLDQPLVHKCWVSAPLSFSAALFPPSLCPWIK